MRKIDMTLFANTDFDFPINGKREEMQIYIHMHLDISFPVLCFSYMELVSCVCVQEYILKLICV